MNGVDLSHYKQIVQGFFDTQPKYDGTLRSPIWCLGREYKHSTQTQVVGQDDNLHDEGEGNTWTDLVNPARSRTEDTPAGNSMQVNGNSISPANTLTEHEARDQAWPSDFLDDCESKFWLTYRSNFPPIMKSSDASMTLSVRLRSLTERGGFTSDTGWGCMIRSGQCVLANALSTLRLGRGWRRRTRSLEEKELISLFADHPDAPFSIHRFVEHGAEACGKHPGEWFGPSATARCIQALSNSCEDVAVKVYVNGDGPDVYEDAFLSTARSGMRPFTPCLILLGVRLGIDRVTPAYWETLRSCLDLPQSVGIAGGRPSSSHYFFAHQENTFFYLDPHFTRPALPLHKKSEDVTVEELDSCHTRKLRSLDITAMDPSMLLAFLIKDEEDWRDWRSRIADMQGKPIIHVADFEPRLLGNVDDRQANLDEVETLDDEDDTIETL